jgi:excisionase family DNA binding protein
MTKLLTIPEFAKETGLKYWLARELVIRGDVESVQVGTRRRVSSEFVEKWTRGSACETRSLSVAVSALDGAAARDPECAAIYRAAADELVAASTRL